MVLSILEYPDPRLRKVAAPLAAVTAEIQKLVRDMAVSAADFTIVLLVGLIAFGVPYGYVLGLVIGTALAFWLRRKPAGFAA